LAILQRTERLHALVLRLTPDPEGHQCLSPWPIWSPRFAGPISICSAIRPLHRFAYPLGACAPVVGACAKAVRTWPERPALEGSGLLLNGMPASKGLLVSCLPAPGWWD